MTGVLDSVLPGYLTGNDPTANAIAGAGGGLGAAFAALKNLPEAAAEGVGQLASSLNPVNLAGQAVGSVTGSDPFTGQKLDPLQRVMGGVMAAGALYGVSKAGLEAYQRIHATYPQLFGPYDDVGALSPSEFFGGRGQAAVPSSPMDPGAPLGALGGPLPSSASTPLAGGFKFPYDEGLQGPYHQLTPDDFLNTRTGDLLRSRTVAGVADAMGMPTPFQDGFLHSMADQYAQLPHHADSTGTLPLGWEITKWQEAVDKGILPKEDIAVWNRLRQGYDVPPAQLAVLQGRMLQFAQDTSWVNDPHLSAHPLVSLKKVVPQADGDWLVFKHLNFHNDEDLSVLSGDASTTRQARLGQLDYRGLAPVTGDNMARLVKVARPEEVAAGKVWYSEAKQLLNEPPDTLRGKSLAGIPEPAVNYIADWREGHPEISGDLLSSVVASISGKQPWTGEGDNWQSGNIVQATKVIDAWLGKAHGSLEELAQMDYAQMAEPTFHGGIFNPKQFANVSGDGFAKAGRLLAGEPRSDVMFGADPKTPSLKTRNFDVNIDQPEAWYPVTADRHFYAGAIGMDPSIDKPVVGDKHQAYIDTTNTHRAVSLDHELLPGQMQAITWETWKRIKAEANASFKRGEPYDPGDGKLIYPPKKGGVFVMDDRILRLIQGEGDLAPHEVASSIPTGELMVPTKSLTDKPVPGRNPSTLSVVANPRTGDKLIVAGDTDANRRAMGVAYPTQYLDARSFNDGKPRPWSTLWAHKFAAPVDDIQAESARIHANQTAGVVNEDNPLLGQGITPQRLASIKDILDITKRQGGASISPVTGEQPSEGIAVGTNPKVGVHLPAAEMTPTVVHQWLNDQAVELARPGMHIGTWHDQNPTTEAGEPNPTFGHVFLDTSKVFPQDQLAAAKKLAKASNQKAIYDIGNDKEIPTGGTGDTEGQWAPHSGPDFEALATYLSKVNLQTPATELHAATADTLPSLQGKHAIVVNGLVDLSHGLDPAQQGRALPVHNSLLRELKMQGVQPIDSQVMNPHQANTAFGNEPRQALVLTYDNSADVKRAWDVITQFEHQYNEPILDRKAYVFGRNEAPAGTVPVFEHHYQGPDGSTLTHLDPSGSLADPHTVQAYIQKEFADTFRGAKARVNTIDRGDDGQTAVYNGAVRVIDKGRGSSVKLKPSSLLDTVRNGEKVKTMSIWVPPTGDIPVMTFSEPEILVRRNPAATPDRTLTGTVKGGRVELKVPTNPGPTGEDVFNLTLFERARQALARAGVSEVVPVT